MSPLVVRTVRLRPVEEADARFILDLRLDPKLARHLSPVADDEAAQAAWIRRYKDREEVGAEFYFVIETRGGDERYGTVRVYDLRPDSFCWGSWIVRPGAPLTAAIESALGVYDFGFGPLGRPKSHFDVRRANDKVVRFHEKFGAVRVREDADNIYFELTQSVYASTRAEFARFCG